MRAGGGLDRRAEAILAAHRHALMAGALAVALGLAWSCRFVQDDAYISFTYARNLVNGEGLTWFGTRVEGYTNLLWTLWIAAGLRIGADAVTWSWTGGLAALVATLTGTGLLAWRLTGRALTAGLTLALLSTNYTFIAYGTGGLETMAQAALLVWATVAAERLARSGEHLMRDASLLSLLAAAAVMTHPDSALPAAILLGWAATGLWRRGSSPAAWAVLLAPGGLLLGAWVAWKLRYYGALLPNTFVAKAGLGTDTVANGALYLARFLHWYWLWPLFAAGLLCLSVDTRRSRERIAVPGLMVASWLGYVVLAGGDFMEFRLLVPVLPLAFLVLAILVCGPVARRLRLPATVWAVVALAVAATASVHHARTFRGLTDDLALDSIDALATFYGVYPDGDWSDLGTGLRAQLGPAAPLLALHPAGAIPYYSGLPTVDQLGLNDAWVARHGQRADATYRRPGHQRHAPVSYLRQRGVNLVIGHPTLVPLDWFARPGAAARLPEWLTAWLDSAVKFNTDAIPEITLLLVPVRPGLALVTWYLTPTPALDALIAGHRWPVMRFRSASATSP